MKDTQWSEVQLGDIIEIKHGWPFKSEFFSTSLTGGPIVVAIGNFRYTGGFRFETTDTKEYRGEYPKEFILTPGDLLVVMTCQTPGGEILGVPARVPDDGRTYLHNQRIGKVVQKPGVSVDQRFLYYLFLWSELNQELVASATGTKIVHTAPSRIEAFRFLLPPQTVQEAVGTILGTLDDKIESNRRLNRTLEEMAWALFQSWFVDFDPVQAKSDGRRPIGLPESVLPLFPAHFEPSKFGPIPKGWRAGCVDDAFRVTMGQSPPGSTYNQVGDGIPFYQGRTDFTFRYPKRRIYCTAATRFADAADTLVSVRAPVGDINMAAEPCAIGRGVAAVRHSSGSRSLTYYAMRSLREEFEIYEGYGTLFGAIGRDDFRRLPWVIAPSNITSSFDAFVGPLDDRIEAGEKELATLESLRDTLLPALLSGEVTIKKAEAIVQEVA